MAETAWADWCVTEGGISISGTRMKEYSRTSVGERWCFKCRKRHEFWWVVEGPDGLSYYDPYGYYDGITRECTDLFPGWTREYEE